MWQPTLLHRPVLDLCVHPVQVDQVRVGRSDIKAQEGISNQDVADIYLRASGLLAWEFDGTMDAPETQREDPLLRQRRDMEDP